jgi:hypothetical protein
MDDSGWMVLVLAEHDINSRGNGKPIGQQDQ